MVALKCDCCGAKLVMEAGGEFASCEFCGMRYSTVRLQEKVQEIMISGEVAAKQTGTKSDVQQWRVLLNKYMDSFDYQSASHIVKKILEAVPDDVNAGRVYDELQELQHFDIRNRTLVKYKGKASVIRIPKGVRVVANDAFYNRETGWVKCNTVIFPEGLIELYDNPIADEMVVPDTVEKGSFTYPAGCHGFKKLRLSKRFQSVKEYNVRACEDLKVLEASENFTQDLLRVVYHEMHIAYDEQGVSKSPWAAPYRRDRLRMEYKQAGRCQHCGGRIKGFFTSRCELCGKPKDY